MQLLSLAGVYLPSSKPAVKAVLRPSSSAVVTLIDTCCGRYDVTKLMLTGLVTGQMITNTLLEKPPFRFLYNIIREIMDTTGFAQG